MLYCPYEIRRPAIHRRRRQNIRPADLPPIRLPRRRRGLIFLCIKLLPIFFGILLAIPLGAFAAALAFYRVNNKPFIDLVQSAFAYTLSDKLYIWKHEKKLAKKKEVVKTDVSARKEYLPRISESKLHDIAWGLDVLEKDKFSSAVLSSGAILIPWHSPQKRHRNSFRSKRSAKGPSS